MAYLFRYREISLQSNSRYLNALAQVDDPTPGLRGLDTITTRKNKEVIAQSAAGLMQAGRIMFPARSPWTQNAVAELLSFPQGANDDFVTALSLMGLKVMQIIGGEAQTIKEGPPRGSWAWFKREMAYQKEQLSAGAVAEVW